MKKVWKKFLSLVLVLSMVLGYMPVSGITAKAETQTNLALNATATANAFETYDFVAANANDGSSTTRWASNAVVGEKWLTLDFGTATTVASVVLKWERCNATDYKIQSSDDNSTWADVKSFTTAPTSFTQTIDFDSAVTARYFRLLISDFSSEATTEDGTSVDWPTVSVFEFEAYGPATDQEDGNVKTGTTEDQPFPAGTAESEKFRIPAMVTLNSGRIVAAADARWNTYRDGGGLDTIVSYSDNKGEDWTYSLANYLGDNGDVYNASSSTAFIDPSLMTDGTNVWMLVDIYPYGVALNGDSGYTAPTTDRGFDSNGRLLLSADSHSTYGYYLEKNSDENLETSYYVIKSVSDDSVVSGYTVDAWFNIKSTDGTTTDSNLFFADSPYKVARTGYLYLTKSTDGGATWEEPQLLNMKLDGEQVLLVGPGRGLITTEGTMIFPCYRYHYGEQYACFIYSSDGGATWERSGYATSGIWSSENQIVELADGTLRAFFRNGQSQVCYVDATGNAEDGYTWDSSNPVLTGLYSCSNTQMSAITYSQKIDGKEAIIISYPASNSSTGNVYYDRFNGRIAIGLVQADGTMDWKYTYEVNNTIFWYSCLTELNDGSISILYENGESGAAIEYANYTLAELAPDAEVTTFWLTDAAGAVADSVTVKPGESATLTVAGTPNGNLSVSSSDENIITASIGDGNTVVVTANAAVTGLTTASVTVTDGTSTYTLPVSVTSATKYETVELTIGETATFIDETGDYSDSNIEGAGDGVADIVVLGNARPAELQVQRATAQGTFDGDLFNISDALYTFTETTAETTVAKTDENNKCYEISSVAKSSSAATEGTDVYLNIASGDNTDLTPNATTASAIEVIAVAGDSETLFKLRDLDITNGRYLHFHGGSGYYFNRCSNDTDNYHSYELYAPAESESEDQVIKGYERVSAIESGESYLIVAKADSGERYLLFPTTGTNNYNHVAKLTSEMSEDLSSTEVEITGTKVGNTSVVVGETTYYITVTTKNYEDITIGVGESYTYTDGDFADADFSDLNTGIANGEVTERTAIVDSKATLATDNTFSGETINLSDCLYTFAGTGTANTYVISSEAADGTTVYLYPNYNNAAGIPNGPSSTNIAISDGNSDGTFYLKRSDRYLHFYDDATKLRFDGVTDNSNYLDTCSFMIFGQDSMSENSAIPGYKQITNLTDIKAGEQYLIVAYRQGGYYVLHPSTSVTADDTARYSHVAKATAEAVEGTVTDLTFTGVSEGETSVVVGNTTYNITVIDRESVTIEVNESYYVDGMIDADATYDTNTIAVENAGTYDSPVLVDFSSMDVGESREVVIVYTNNSNKYAITSGGTTEDNTTCRALAAINADSSLEDYVWVVTKAEDGYTIQTKDGQYLTGNGNALTLGAAPFSFQFTYADDGSCQVSYTSSGTKYFNNYGGRNSGIGGYGSDAISVQLWLTKTAIVGKTPGTTEVVIGGKTYQVTVERKEVDVYMTVGDTETLEGVAESNSNDTVATISSGNAYTAVTEIVSGGQYLIGDADAIVKGEEQTSCSDPQGSGTWYTAGLNIDSATFTGTDYSAYLWTFTAVPDTTDQYYVQTPDGKYLNIGTTNNGNNAVTLFDATANPDSEIPTVTVTAVTGGYTLGATGSYTVYLNNFGAGSGSDAHAAGWTNGTTWTLYESSSDSEITVTAVTAGTTDITTADTIYHVTVLNNAASYKDVYLETGESVVVQDTTGNYADQVGEYDKNSIDVTAAGSDAGTEITFTGKKAGRQEVQIGTTLYYVYVTESEGQAETEDVVIYTGQTVELSSEVNGTTPEVKGEGFDTYLKDYSLTGTNTDVLAVRSNVTQTVNNVTYYYVGKEVLLSDCLYTFTLNDDGTTYKISAVTSDGTTVYIDHQDATNNYVNTQDTDSDANVYVQDAGNGKFAFAVDSGDTTNPYRFLHFFGYDNGTNTHKLAGGNSASLTATGLADGYKFDLYRPVTGDEVSSTEIPGYIKVTSVDSIVSGEQYIIVASHTCSDTTCYYALYPSLETNGTYHSAQTVRITGHEMDIKSHEVTFTGLAAGTTTLQADNKTYNITVLEQPANATVESTPFISEQSGSSNGMAVTKLSISADRTFDLGIGNDYEGEVTWKIVGEDGTTAADWATISEDGVITATDPDNYEDTFNGYIVATIDGVEYKIPLKLSPAPIAEEDGTENRLYDLYLSYMYHTDVYYGWLYGYSFDDGATTSYGYTELTKAVEGEVIYVSVNSDRFNALDFFAEPEEGYALAHMGSTNSQSHYMKISGNDPTTTAFITTEGVAGYQQYNLAPDATAGLVQLALDLNCDGAQGFTRYEGDGAKGVNSVLTYRSEKLPTVEKEVLGVLDSSGLREDWQTAEEGKTLTAEINDYVYFRVTVQTYDAEDLIVYSDVHLTDLLEGAAFYTKDPNDLTKPINGNDSVIDITADINADGLVGNTHEYYVVYQISRDDVFSVDHKVVNEVSLDYHFSSEYSAAVYGGIGLDDAAITITTTMAENLIVDFGLPVEYVFESAKQLVEQTNVPIDYGTVTVTSVLNDNNKYTNTVTYTPVEVIQGYDTITLEEVSTDTYEGKTILIGVYPATSVYYEEGFMTYDGTWSSTGSRGTDKQEVRLMSTKFAVVDKYGYDSKYAMEAAGPSNGTEALSETAGNTASFNFTGTGVDIYANCTPDTGNTTIVVRETPETDGETGAIKKLMIVNTKMAIGEGTSTSGQNINAYNIPIASVSGLEHGGYSVKIQHSTTKVTNEDGKVSTESRPVKLDGFRVYNTLEDSSAFEVHNEADPTFVEMRNVVLNSIDLDNVLAVPTVTPTAEETSAGSIYAEDIAAGLTQVLNQNETGGAVILTPSSTSYTVDNIKDLLDNGPKNEIFLYEGQTLAFKLAAGLENVQIGMKAVNDGVAVQLMNGDSAGVATLTSSTDMFFGLGDVGEVEKTIAITNVDDGDSATNRVLSVTDLKYFTAAGTETASVFGRMTEEDFMPVLLSMGYESDPNPVENPYTDVAKSDYYYNAVLWAAENNITSGISATEFGPNAACTRAQVVTFLWRAAGCPAPTTAECAFVDVDSDDYYYNAVLWAVENGITSGYKANSFAPDETVTRGQVVTFIHRANGTPASSIENPFTDVDAEEYYYDAVLWAVENNITSGTSESTFSPEGACTRGQVVTFLYNTAS